MNVVFEAIAMVTNLRFIMSLVATFFIFAPGYMVVLYYKPEWFMQLDFVKLTILAGCYACFAIVPQVLATITIKFAETMPKWDDFIHSARLKSLKIEDHKSGKELREEINKKLEEWSFQSIYAKEIVSSLSETFCLNAILLVIAYTFNLTNPAIFFLLVAVINIARIFQGFLIFKKMQNKRVIDTLPSKR